MHSFVVDGGPLSGKVGIKSIAFSKDGKQYLLNSMDRAIRIYNVEDNSFSMKLCVTVDRFQWKVAHFYGDDYVISCMSFLDISISFDIFSHNFKALQRRLLIRFIFGVVILGNLLIF